MRILLATLLLTCALTSCGPSETETRLDALERQVSDLENKSGDYEDRIAELEAQVREHDSAITNIGDELSFEPKGPIQPLSPETLKAFLNEKPTSKDKGARP